MTDYYEENFLKDIIISIFSKKRKDTYRIEIPACHVYLLGEKIREQISKAIEVMKNDYDSESIDIKIYDLGKLKISRFFYENYKTYQKGDK